MKIEWTDDLNTGVPEMDEQHKQLIAPLNEFYTAVEQGDREEGIRRLKAIRGLVAFLFSWLYTHISRTDKRYGAFARRGAAQN